MGGEGGWGEDTGQRRGGGLELHLVGREWAEDNATRSTLENPSREQTGRRGDGRLKKKKAKHNFWNHQADCKTLGGLTPVSLVCYVTS